MYYCMCVCVVTAGELDGMIMLWNVVEPAYRVQMIADERVNPATREMIVSRIHDVLDL